MDDEEVLYRFTLPYPWKKTLVGIKWITIGILMILLPIFIYQDYTKGVLFSFFNILGYMVFILVMISLYFLMRYVLLHGDKIQTPIEVWVDREIVHFRKGRVKMDFSMTGMKTVRLMLTDKIVMVETNYEKDEDWRKGWRVAFKRNNELQEVDYRKFIEETFLPFAEVVINRLKELNPGIKVVKEDKRKKYR